MKLPTITVISDDHDGAEVIINETDFDASRHRLPGAPESENSASTATTPANAPEGTGAGRKDASQSKAKGSAADKAKDAKPKGRAKDDTAKGETPESSATTDKPETATGEGSDKE